MKPQVIDALLMELDQIISVANEIKECNASHKAFIDTRNLIVQTFHMNKKLLLCGNGGSAADCQHIAAELVVRYKQERPPYPAIALTTDTSILTAHSNDYNFETVFSRQIEALGREGDTLIAISTSGNSRNILVALEAAKNRKLHTVLLSSGAASNTIMADICYLVPSRVTSIIQIHHMIFMHSICDTLDPC